MTVGGVDESGNRSAVVELTTLNPFTNPIQPCYENLNPFPRPVSDAAGGPIGKLKLKFKVKQHTSKSALQTGYK